MEKDRNQRSETILNFTLEIIYLLTGEDCVIVTKTSGENVTSSGHQLSGGWNRTQSSNMEHQSLIHERNNDLKILELTNKIIHLLTGEDRDYVEGLKDVVMGNKQPLVSSDLPEAKEISGEFHSFVSSPDCTHEGSTTELNIQGTKYEGNVMDNDYPQLQCSYTSLKEEPCDKGDFINPDVQTQMEYMSCHTKEECASPKEEILPDTDITAPTDYTQPQSTDIRVTSEEQSLRDTDNCTSSGHTHVTYTDVHVKLESDTCGVQNVTDTVTTLLLETKHSPSLTKQIHQSEVIIDTDHPQIQSSYISVKEESCDKGDLIDPDIQTPTNHAQMEYMSCHMKEECASPKEESPSDRDITAPPDYTQPQSTDTKVTSEEESLRDSASVDVKYTNIHIKEESDTRGVENVTDTEYSTPSVEAQHSFFVMDEIDQAQEKPFLCPVCGKRFKCKPGFVNHQKRHTGENMYSCSECGKTFPTKSHLNNHQKLHTEDKQYPCVECGKCFTNKWYLVNHHKVHTKEKPFSCSECEKSFSKKSYFVRHQKLHIGDRPYFCSECGKSFVTKESLVSHMQIHAQEKSYSCSECGKCFISKKYLNRHIKIHTGEKPYSCSECGKCFVTKSNLIKHHMLHTGERPFPCVECGKSFITNAKLVLHQKIHTKHKPFSCSVCGKCFTAKCFLVTHRKIHTGDKIYSCTECEKCYTNKSALNVHLRAHTGVKPYCCDECGKQFTMHSSLFRHQKIHSK